MTSRRGMALLAALWFVVAIATVALALGLEAREHRAVGVIAADRRAAEAAAAGGLAIARARLEQALRQLPHLSGTAANRLRAADPWLDPDSLFPETVYMGDVAVHLHGEDLQSKLNISTVGVTELRTFLGFLLQDYGLADALAQSITDWRDRDDLPQPRGAESGDYLASRRLDLPGNRGGFRDIEELRSVQGMTPAVFARIRPYLRVQGDPAINVNTAPPAVLRAVPGMTDAVLARILAIRSQHQRISSPEELGLASPQQRGNAWFVNGRRGGQGGMVFETTQLALTVTAVPPPPARPVREVWTLERAGNEAQVRWTDYAY